MNCPTCSRTERGKLTDDLTPLPVSAGPQSGAEREKAQSTTLQFDTGGWLVTVEANVSKELYLEAKQGRTLAVRYANTDPRTALLESE